MQAWWDAIVVGAGPAGCLAAHTLARAGARVAVLEARPIPRYKTCGGGVVWRTWRQLPIDPDSIEWLGCTRAEFNLVDPSFSHTVERDVPIVVMTMRSQLDAALAAAARDAGATIRTGSALRSLRCVDGGVEVGAGGEMFRARFVIAADGASGPTRRLAGWSRPLPRVPAVEWEALAKSPEDGASSRIPRFFFGLGGPGYSWVFPKRGHLSIGALSSVRGACDLGDQIEGMLRRAGVGELQSVKRHGFLIPVRPADEDVARGRVMLAGDAAGLVDPVTWEGIGHACTSGRLAAESLLASEFRAEEAGPRYLATLRDEVLSELRWARRFSRLLYGPAWLRRTLFGALGVGLCEAMTDVVLGESGYRELVTSPRALAQLAASPLERSPA